MVRGPRCGPWVFAAALGNWVGCPSSPFTAKISTPHGRNDQLYLDERCYPAPYCSVHPRGLGDQQYETVVGHLVDRACIGLTPAIGPDQPPKDNWGLSPRPCTDTRSARAANSSHTDPSHRLSPLTTYSAWPAPPNALKYLLIVVHKSVFS